LRAQSALWIKYFVAPACPERSERASCRLFCFFQTVNGETNRASPLADIQMHKKPREQQDGFVSWNIYFHIPIEIRNIIGKSDRQAPVTLCPARNKIKKF
jgi:hypothetical protein